jgi:hypothetical protein
MNTNRPPTVMFKGRYLGIAVLVALQVLIGFIHVVFGLWLISASTAPLDGIASFGPDGYSVYTVIFGFLTLGLAVLLWMQKRWSWVGTVAVLAFVIVVDSLALLSLPSIPGIPKFAGFGEISYSIVVILYLLQEHVRADYRIQF